MKNFRVVGIDPGISGAFALCVDGTIVDVRDMVTIPEIISGKARNRPNPSLMADLFDEWQKAGPFCAYIEKVQSIRGEGAVGAFAFGKGAGMIEGVLAGLRIPFTLVSPQIWKRTLNVPADKNAARARACQLFPNMAGRFARVKDDGRAEAALIALFGHRDIKGAMS